MNHEDQSAETAQVVAQRCACRSWFCDRCAVRMGLVVRTAIELYSAATCWVPFAVTLSVNPAWFDSPDEAYDFCRKFIGKFVEELRRREREGPGGEIIERCRYFGTASDSVDTIAAIFGIWSEGQELVALGQVPLADVPYGSPVEVIGRKSGHSRTRNGGQPAQRKEQTPSRDEGSTSSVPAGGEVYR